MSRKFKITLSESRNLLVPDISRMVERYVNREVNRIYDLAEQIYRMIIPVIMNQEIARKEFIIEKFVDIYIVTFGINFATLLKKNENEIGEEGVDFPSNYDISDLFLTFIFPLDTIDRGIMSKIRKNINRLIFGFWTYIGRQDGYLKSDENVRDYFDAFAMKLNPIQSIQPVLLNYQETGTR